MQMKRQTKRYVIALAAETAMSVSTLRGSSENTYTPSEQRVSGHSGTTTIYSHTQIAFSYLEIFIKSGKIPT